MRVKHVNLSVAGAALTSAAARRRWAALAAAVVSLALLGAHPVAAMPAPRDASDCDSIQDLDSVSPEFLAELFGTGLAEAQTILEECLKGSTPSSPPLKLKKPKIPKASPPAFWAYVRYAHVDMSFKTIPLDDPEICSKFLVGNSLVVRSATPGFVVVGEEYGELPVTSALNEAERSWPSGCEAPPEPRDGAYSGYFTMSMESARRLELGSSVGCYGYLPMPPASLPCTPLSLSETLPQYVALSPGVQRDLRNPRKGIIRINLSGGGAGNAGSEDPRTCTNWGDGDADYTCGWASSWRVQLILVRADIFDRPITSQARER